MKPRMLTVLATMPYALALTLAGGSAWADVKAGVDAWSQGDYAKALKIWRPLAESGDADAQFRGKLAGVEFFLGFSHHLMQRTELAPALIELVNILARREIQNRRRGPLGPRYQPDLVVLALVVELLGEMRQVLRVNTAQLVGKLDLGNGGRGADDSGGEEHGSDQATLHVDSS